MYSKFVLAIRFCSAEIAILVGQWPTVISSSVYIRSYVRSYVLPCSTHPWRHGKTINTLYFNFRLAS